jgi:uncharacterized protein (DUF433 family)
MTTEHPRVVLDPAVLAGKPVIRGTRLSVEFVIGLMAEGWNETDIMTNYSGIYNSRGHHGLPRICASSSEKVFPSAA